MPKTYRITLELTEEDHQLLLEQHADVSRFEAQLAREMGHALPYPLALEHTAYGALMTQLAQLAQLRDRATKPAQVA